MFMWSARASESSGVTGPTSRRIRPRLSSRLVRSAGSSSSREAKRSASNLVATVQTEHVGPMVVARRVEALALGEEQLRVELRVEHALLVPERPGEVAPVGPEDRGAAAADELVALGQRHVVREARGALEDAAREHEGTGLSRDVAHRVVPHLRVLGGRREVELDAGLVEREARERHEVLPADQPADAAEIGLDRL